MKTALILCLEALDPFADSFDANGDAGLGLASTSTQQPHAVTGGFDKADIPFVQIARMRFRHR